MEEAESRMEGLVRAFIADYLPPLIGLLADEGLDQEDQISRVDRLVGGLLGAGVESTLTKRGRRVVVDINDALDPPKITYNGGLIESLDPSERMGLFEKPTAEILGLSTIRVSLVLGLDDQDSLNNLANRARRAAESTPVGLADIPSVVENRLELFLTRLASFVATLEEDPEFDVDIEDGAEAIVASDETRWPGWESVKSHSFVSSLLFQLEVALPEDEAHPAAETTAEIVWESLDLSAHSFLRHAAQLLRAERKPEMETESILRTLADIVGSKDEPISESVSDWDTFSDLADTWASLFRTEQRMLAWSVVRRKTPDLSVYEPPLDSLGLNEPSSLPWGVPLLGWSLREQSALRDLLDGQQTTIENELDERRSLSAGGADTEAPSLDVSGETDDLNVTAAGTYPALGEDDRRRTELALHATWGHLIGRFEQLSAAKKKRVLQAVKGCYGGYFGHSNPVWKRRFQAWEDYDPADAFQLLAGELENILGPRAMFDPFQNPDGTQVRQVPTFNIIVAFGESDEVAHVRVPLVALRSAFDDAPTRVRAIEVPDDEEGDCRWLGDSELTVRTLVDLPAEDIFGNIENDEVGLKIERS